MFLFNVDGIFPLNKKIRKLPYLEFFKVSKLSILLKILPKIETQLDNIF